MKGARYDLYSPRTGPRCAAAARAASSSLDVEDKRATVERRYSRAFPLNRTVDGEGRRRGSTGAGEKSTEIDETKGKVVRRVIRATRIIRRAMKIRDKWIVAGLGLESSCARYGCRAGRLHFAWS